MTTAEIPQRTAIEHTLSNGTKVWIQTLNAAARDEARSKADFYAGKLTLEYRKGAEFYEVVLADFEDKDRAFQELYLAEWRVASGDTYEQLANLHPVPDAPERGEMDDEAFDAALVAWQEQVAEVNAARVKFETEAMDAAVKAAKALKPAKLLEECALAWRQRERRRIFGQRFVVEVLYRAVRKHGERTVRYFDSVDAVDELDDTEREALSNVYYGVVDTVSPSDIPTSPAGS